MDLLSGAASRVTSRFSFLTELGGTYQLPIAANAGKRRKPGQDAARFKTEDDTGKMVIDESDDEAQAVAGGEDVEGNAYRETLTSVDGFKRGPNGKVKFNKDTKKRRRENEEADDDVEMADANQQTAGKRNKRKTEPKFGHEFKAKVRIPKMLDARLSYQEFSPPESRRRCQKGRCGSICLHVPLASREEAEPRSSYRDCRQTLSALSHVYFHTPCIPMYSISYAVHYHGKVGSHLRSGQSYVRLVLG